MTKNSIIRILYSVLLIPVGALMIMLEPETAASGLLSNLGLAFVVAGVFSTFHEGIIKRLEGNETATEVAERVHEKFRDHPLSATGIRIVSPVRKGFAGYYLWAINSQAQRLFFAGRSVLHRIDADFRIRGLGSAEVVLARRVREGSNIRIMFLDPRSTLIHRLAEEEGQTSAQLMRDLATSIGVVVRLSKLLARSDRGMSATQAQVQIRLYDEVPYFAYHCVDDAAIVGFYFSSALGHASAAYELVDTQTRSFFEGHFVSMFERARECVLFELDRRRGTAVLNEQLLWELRSFLSDKIGDDVVANYIPTTEDE